MGVDYFTVRQSAQYVSNRIDFVENNRIFAYRIVSNQQKMNIHTLIFSPKNWMGLAQELSQLDRFDAQWQAVERREQKTLKELKSIATVRSVGASTRIEGSTLTDKEVEVLIENLDISKLTERDEQEVIGYYKTLNLIAESYRDIPVAESSIKHLHNTLMKHSSKDGYHKGDYKISANRVEKTMPDGTK